MSEEIEELISIREFGRRAGDVSDTTIRDYIAQSKIPSTAIKHHPGNGRPQLIYHLAKKAYCQYNPFVVFTDPVPIALPPKKEKPQPVAKAPRERLPKAKPDKFEKVKPEPPAAIDVNPPQPNEKTGKISVSDRIAYARAKREEAKQFDDGGARTEMDAEKIAQLEAERRKKSAEAQIAELNLQERLGKLVPIDGVNKSLFAFGIEIRDAVMEVPERVIDSVLAADDRQEALNILVVELNKALLALSDENRTLVKKK